MPIASSSELPPESPASTFAPVRLIRSGGTPQRTQSVVSSFFQRAHQLVQPRLQFAPDAVAERVPGEGL